MGESEGGWCVRVCVCVCVLPYSWEQDTVFHTFSHFSNFSTLFLFFSHFSHSHEGHFKDGTHLRR